ncbi:MAG: DMT family transporter [Simkaniaceae bacterium]|nr:DMT family transporter [Simkaniaceae bacterium]
MVQGVLFALGACFIWGLIFVVPQFMGDVTSLEITLSRYLFYGLISTLIFCKDRLKKKCHYPLFIWVKAFHFSLISTIFYYTCLVLALRYATPAIAALILGVSPILIAFYGNAKHKEVTYRSLLIPSLLILIGLVMINIPHFKQANSPSSYTLGLLCSLASLLAWSWFVVANSRFLKNHVQVRSGDWSTLMGVAALFWALLFSLILFLFFDDQLNLEKLFTPGRDLVHFLLGGAILGLLCSWVGSFLWNKASLHLPVALAGQLTIFETIFGVTFVYLIAREFPPMWESLGILLLLTAILYGIKQFARKKSSIPPLSPH